MRFLQAISRLLATQTSAFIILVAILTFWKPELFLWVKGDVQTAILGIIMLTMGMTLTTEDFRILAKRPLDIFIGACAQYTIMPLLAYSLVKLMNLPNGIAAGLILVGCCPGGVSSNIMSFLCKGDVAFSVGMTTASTLLAPVATPLLVLWLGYGALPKVVLVIVTTFFPVTVSLASGFRSVDPDVVDLMRTMNASRWQIFRYAKLPAAADQFFSGLKISATYAIVGAVIAEWLGGSVGLGVYMTRVRKSFSYDRLFASIIIISILSLGLMKLVELAQRAGMPWKRAERNKNER